MDTATAARDQATEKSASLQAEIDALKKTRIVAWCSLLEMFYLIQVGRAKAETARNLDQLAQFLTAHPDRRIQIDGFTDSVGSDSVAKSNAAPTSSLRGHRFFEDWRVMEKSSREQ